MSNPYPAPSPLLARSRRAALAASVAFAVACSATLGPTAAIAQDGWWGSGERIEGSGKRSSDNRSVVGDFSHLSVAGSWGVVLRQGSSQAVTVEGDDNLLQYIETRVDGKTLHIQPRKGVRLVFKERPVVTVNFVNLSSVSLGGSNDLQSSSLKGDRLEVNLGGAGSAKFDGLDVKRFSANIGGSGSVHGKGKADRQDFSIGGSGTVRAEGLEGERVNVSIGGSGNIRVWAKSSLDVSVAGSGSVLYKGDPKVNRSVVGSGTVRKLEE
jgi:hypothetical protein